MGLHFIRVSSDCLSHLTWESWFFLISLGFYRSLRHPQRVLVLPIRNLVGFSNCSSWLCKVRWGWTRLPWCQRLKLDVDGLFSWVCFLPPAADLLEAMNATADPCDDFFQFACGGWVRKNPIPDSKSRYTQFDVLRDQLTATMKSKNDVETSVRCCWQNAGHRPSSPFRSMTAPPVDKIVY